MGGAIVGLGQLVFLMFASIQCDGKVEDWIECNRTLSSQTGLSYMVALVVIIMLVSGVIPKEVLLKHTISLKRVMAMYLSNEESFQAFGHSVAFICALYLLGSYGAEGDFISEAEKYTLLSATLIIGCGSLIVTAVWTMVFIRRAMKRREVGQECQNKSLSDNMYAVEVSSFWFYSGVLVVVLYSTLGIAVGVTADVYYQTLTRALLPIPMLLLAVAFFCQPRKSSPRIYGHCEYSCLVLCTLTWRVCLSTVREKPNTNW